MTSPARLVPALAALAVCLLVISPAAAASPRPVPPGAESIAAAPAGLPLSQAQLRALLAKAVRESGVPGLVARLATPETFIGSAFGVRQRGAAPRFGPDDPVHIGSCLKAMTATVVGRLVDRGLVEWETTVADVFPDLAGSLDPAIGSLTFEELLAHRSGLTDDISNELLEAIATFHGSGREARLRFLPPYLADQPRGIRGQYGYSNLGYTLVGAMLERVTGTAFEELLRAEVFAPLEMRSARFGPPGSNDPAVIDAPRGHGADHRPLLPIEQFDVPFISPAGMYSMTLKDWSKFALSQLGIPIRGRLLLSPASLARIQTAVGGTLPPPLAPASYGLGWLLLPLGDTVLLVHDGSNLAWFSEVLINRKSGRILLISTNEASDRALAALGAVTSDPRVAGWLVGH